jgi:hypothetical protein
VNWVFKTGLYSHVPPLLPSFCSSLIKIPQGLKQISSRTVASPPSTPLVVAFWLLFSRESLISKFYSVSQIRFDGAGLVSLLVPATPQVGIFVCLFLFLLSLLKVVLVPPLFPEIVSGRPSSFVLRIFIVIRYFHLLTFLSLIKLSESTSATAVSALEEESIRESQENLTHAESEEGDDKAEVSAETNGEDEVVRPSRMR